jgi:hypothetical protein
MKTTATAVLTLLLAASAGAQEGQRDPMQPPPALRAAAAPGGSAPADAAPVVARHLMVIDGVRYVIDNGRRRGVGDLLGSARIERIEDSAIVVRNGKQLQRLPLFAGVVKRPVAEPLPPSINTKSTTTPAGATTAARPAAATQTAQALTACADRPPCMQRPGEPR